MQPVMAIFKSTFSQGDRHETGYQFHPDPATGANLTPDAPFLWRRLDSHVKVIKISQPLMPISSMLVSVGCKEARNDPKAFRHLIANKGMRALHKNNRRNVKEVNPQC